MMSARVKLTVVLLCISSMVLLQGSAGNDDIQDHQCTLLYPDRGDTLISGPGASGNITISPGGDWNELTIGPIVAIYNGTPFVSLDINFTASISEIPQLEIKLGFDHNGDGDFETWARFDIWRPLVVAGSRVHITNGSSDIDGQLKDLDMGYIQLCVRDASETGIKMEIGESEFIRVPFSLDSPVAVAGPNMEGYTNVEVSFNGSSSYHQMDRPFQLLWDIDASDGLTWELSGEVVNHTYTYWGTYTVTLNATDGKNWHLDTLEVTVIRQDPPVAVIDSDGKSAGRFENINFDGLSSSDPDGDTLRYFWDFGDGSTSKNPLSHHYWEKPGFYTVTLWVSDGLFNVSTSIQVQITNNLPELEIILDNEPMFGAPVFFNATGIGDPDGDNVTFLWDMGDGSPTIEGILVNHTYYRAGNYTVSLYCNDTFDTVSKQKTISIPRNKGPLIRVNAKELAFIDRTHWLDASLSEDPEGHELSFRWDFPDGTSAEGPEVNYTFEDYGDQTVTLTVEDEYGESSQKILSFTVKDYESYYPTLQDINEPFSRTDVVQEPYIYYSWIYDHYTGEVTPVAHKGGGYRIYVLDLPPGYWRLTLNVIEGGNVDLLSFDEENYYKYMDDFSTVVDTMDPKTSMRSSGISFGFYGSDTIYFIVDNNEVMAFGATPVGNVTYTISVSQGTPPDNTPWDDDDDVEEDNAPYWIIYVFFIGLPLLVIVGITVGGIIYSVTRSKRKDMGREQMERELRESVILGRGTIGRSPEPPAEEEPQADGDGSTPEQEEQVDPGMSLINEILFDTSNGPNQQMPNGTTEKGEEDPFGTATGEGEQDGGRLADILFSADDIDEDPDLAPMPPEN